MDGAGLGEWRQCSMCVSGQQLGIVYYSLPLGRLFFPSSLGRTTPAGAGGAVLASSEQMMERASLERQVVSRDLPWRTLKEQTAAVNHRRHPRFTLQHQHLSPRTNFRPQSKESGLPHKNNTVNISAFSRGDPHSNYTFIFTMDSSGDYFC